MPIFSVKGTFKLDISDYFAALGEVFYNYDNNRVTFRDSIAHAAYEEADALMLSGETSVGRYPERCVEALVRISTRIERSGGQGFGQGVLLRDERQKIARAAMRLRDTIVLCCKSPGDLQRDLLRKAIERVIAMIAPLLATYAIKLGAPHSAVSDAIFTIAPPPAASSRRGSM